MIPTAFRKVRDALSAAHITFEGAEITNLPNNTVPVEGEAAQKLLKLINSPEDHDEVQNVSHSAEIPDTFSV